jgi:hypothetical protein
VALVKTGRNQKGSVTITVVAQESGKRYEIAARYDTPLGKIIEDVYREVGLEPNASTRLICESTGEDVSSYSRLDLGQYHEARYCRELVWLFAFPKHGDPNHADGGSRKRNRTASRGQ